MPGWGLLRPRASATNVDLAVEYGVWPSLTSCHLLAGPRVGVRTQRGDYAAAAPLWY